MRQLAAAFFWFAFTRVLCPAGIGIAVNGPPSFGVWFAFR